MNLITDLKKSGGVQLLENELNNLTAIADGQRDA
jgi:hypothetical protein